MKITKLLSAALAAVMLLGLVACGGNGPIPAETTAQPPVTTAGTTADTSAGPSSTNDTTAGTTAPDTTQGSTAAPGTTSESTPPVTTEDTTPVTPSRINYLTGLPLDYGEDGTRRPTLVVINNIRIALPQSGLVDADVIYEVEAEANITRLLAVYYNPEKVSRIGTVRSTRSVIVNITLGLDAVMVHAGGSPQALADIERLGCTAINAQRYGTTFYYDEDRMDQKGMEHSLYTTGTKLMTRWNTLRANGTRTTLKQGYDSPFTFAAEEYIPVGQSAQRVQTVYGVVNPYAPFFYFNKETDTYYRYEFGTYHIDENTGEQLSFKNILALSVPSKVVDSEGRRQFEDVGTGTGYYISNGTAVQIYWSKASETSPMVYKNLDGSILELNPGKTFVSYVNGMSNIKITG
ncbi:MAG: DUF3048 domain-containing protein [Clostridia bacterium]|nr:DUF3048 domain-containing protein [Clostridia bacterium]